LGARKASKALIDDRPILVLPRLAQMIGLNEAIALQQIHYWLAPYEDRGDLRHYHDGRYWIYNSLPEWRKQFPFWSERTIQRILRDLETPFTPRGCDLRISRGPLLLSACLGKDLKKDPWDRTKWYTIDRDELARLEVALSMTTSCRDGGRQDGTIDNDRVSSSPHESTGSENSNQRGVVAATTTAENSANGAPPPSLRSREGTPAQTATQDLDYITPLRFYFGRRPSRGQISKVAEAIADYRTTDQYAVTQTDLNAAVCLAALYSAEHDNHVGTGVVEIELNTVVQAELAKLRAKREGKQYFTQGVPIDVLTPLTELLQGRPTHQDVIAVIAWCRRWEARYPYCLHHGVIRDLKPGRRPRTVTTFLELLDERLKADLSKKQAA
jgi:hypothetical protein